MSPLFFSQDVILSILILVTAALYASVGQAGASGYLALMGLAGFDPAVMKPTALALNIVVALIGTVQLGRAGLFRWRNFYPFGVLGFPFSLVGGAVHLPSHIYYPIVGTLSFACCCPACKVGVRAAGGYYASANQPTVPGIAASGCRDRLRLRHDRHRGRNFPRARYPDYELGGGAPRCGCDGGIQSHQFSRGAGWIPWWIIGAAIGGLFGATFGNRYLPEKALRYVLAGILVISGCKLMLS